MSRTGARQIRDMLQLRVHELVAKLFPHERVPSGPVFMPRNPTRNDRNPGSFVIWMRGAAAGGFNEYSPAGPPASGDVIDLIAYVHNRPGDRKFALAWAEDFLGIRAMSAADLKNAKRQAEQQARTIRQAESEQAARRRRRAQELYIRAQPTIEGTLAETYLASRKIPWRAIRHPEADLRFLPSLEHWKSAEWKDGIKIRPGPKFPAMVAAMRNGSGDVTAVHCTFLRADGSGKADVENPKLMLGPVRGAVIRLSRGPDDLTWEEAAANGMLNVLIAGEGIETMLSVALAVPEARCVAAGSFDNLRNVPVDHPCVEAVIVARDNDEGAKAEEKFQDLLEALARHGKPVSWMRPHAGKDFNDLLRA